MERSKEQILDEIEKLKKQIEELNGKIIDKELPKDYEKMSEEEKKAYKKRQDKLKKEALMNIDNYSVVVNNHTMVSYSKNKAMVNSFVRDVGKLSSIPLTRDTFTRTVPDNYKDLHRKNLEEIEKLIERYNSTKAIRNDRVEFGANFENFASVYFNGYAIKTLNAKANRLFLQKYERQLDKNDNVIGDKFKFQNLTDTQKKDLIKIRIKLFTEKLDKLQIVASKKVKRDNKARCTTFLEKYGFVNSQARYRNGAKKFTTVKSVVSNRGVDMAKIKNNKSKLTSKKETEEKTREEQNKSRLIELNIMREKFDKFILAYRGNGRQFSIEFEQNFPELAEKLYKQKHGDNISFRSQNLVSSPISVQQHEIEKQFDEEFRKANYRLFYKSYYIPASYSQKMNYLGKVFTNAKTKSEKNLDQMKVREYEKELKVINLRGETANYETNFDGMNLGIQKEFLDYVNKELKTFNRLSDKSKNDALIKFLSSKIDRLKSVVHKNKFFSLGTEKIEKLSGVLISRDEKLMSKDVKSITEILGVEEAEKYKFITQNVKELNTKLNHEKSEVEKLGQTLEVLSQKEYSYETNQKMQSVISEIDARNKKLTIISSSLDEALRKKSVLENSFASKQIEKAMESKTSKIVSHNTSKSVFDKYAFPAVDSFGDKYYIEKNTIEGKQVEKIVSNFIMGFKNQVQNMKVAFGGTNYVEIDEFIKKLEDRIEDDFGSIIRDLKKTQKFLKSQMEKTKESQDKSLENELEICIQRFSKNESDVIRKLKSMNIEIGDVTLAKNIK